MDLLQENIYIFVFNIKIVRYNLILIDNNYISFSTTVNDLIDVS